MVTEWQLKMVINHAESDEVLGPETPKKRRPNGESGLRLLWALKGWGFFNRSQSVTDDGWW